LRAAILFQWNDFCAVEANVMADAKTYIWSAAYQAAVLGSSPDSAGSRISDALGALKARIESGAPISDSEYNDIQDAVLVLQALQAEISPS
jgi:hypothetical protein